MVTTIYLVRHAEAEGNLNETFQGSLETALTEKGRRQLRALTERFREIPLDALYVSPMQRTIQTAEAINRHHGLPLHRVYSLREIDGGDWEGLHWSVLPSRFPKEYALWQDNMALFCAPHGDAMSQVYQRMQVTLSEIAAACLGQTIAVVSHGCALRNFLCAVEFGSIARLRDVGWSDNTAVSLVQYAPDTGFQLVYKNDASHLPVEDSTLRTSQWCQPQPTGEAVPK